jgi:hypothetical protein
MAELCGRAADSITERLAEASLRTMELWATARGSFDVCVSGGGFRLFGNRGSKNLRSLLGDLEEFGRAKINEQLINATARLYRAIQNGLEDRLRDLQFCRQRLSNLERSLESANSGSQADSHPGLMPPTTNGAALASTTSSGGEQVLLPFGESDLDWAAARFVLNVSAEQWTRLEEVLQSLVLDPLGGLHAICQKPGDMVGQLAGPMIDQTAAYLGNILKISDIATGDFVAGGKRANLVAMIEGCFDRARPLLPGDRKFESSYLILPATEAGVELAEEIRPVMPSVKVLHAAGQTSDITICREQGHLLPRDLQHLFTHCRDAYRELATAPATSPHARFDILEWVPLDV